MLPVYSVRLGASAMLTLAMLALAMESGAGRCPAAAGGGQPEEIKLSIKTPLGEELSKDERRQIEKFLLAHLKADAKTARVRLLSARRSEGEREKRDLVKAITFDYDAGKATRFTIDLPTNRVVEQEALPGAPQPSREEVEEAKEIMRRDAKLADLLPQGTLAGGFLERSPPGKERTHRLIEFQLLSKDRKDLLRVIVVDLTDRKVSSVTQPK